MSEWKCGGGGKAWWPSRTVQYVVDKARSICNVAMCRTNVQSKVKVALVGVLTYLCHGKVDAHCSPGRDNVLGEWWGAGELGNIPHYLLTTARSEIWNVCFLICHFSLYLNDTHRTLILKSSLKRRRKQVGGLGRRSTALTRHWTEMHRVSWMVIEY